MKNDSSVGDSMINITKLTDAEFYDAMMEPREIIMHSSQTLNPLWYMSTKDPIDSVYWAYFRNDFFVYDGYICRGSDLNYYTQGMAWARQGFSIDAGYKAIAAWKYSHTASQISPIIAVRNLITGDIYGPPT